MRNDTKNDQSSTFAVQRMYAMVSSEVPGVPEVFELTKSPHLDVKLNIESRASTAKIGNYIVELTIVVTATEAEKTLFLVEVKQGGIFTIEGVPEEALSQITKVDCPMLLYPYASALISDLVGRAGFVPLHLPPEILMRFMKEANEPAS